MSKKKQEPAWFDHPYNDSEGKVRQITLPVNRIARKIARNHGSKPGQNVPGVGWPFLEPRSNPKRLLKKASLAAKKGLR